MRVSCEARKGAAVTPPQEKTGVPTIAAALGKPDECPVCGQDWRRNSCSHQAMYAEDLSVLTQVMLYKLLQAKDREKYATSPG